MSYVPFIDIFERNGKPYNRIDIKIIMQQYGLELLSIRKIKFPRLSWSNRKINEVD